MSEAATRPKEAATKVQRMSRSGLLGSRTEKSILEKGFYLEGLGLRASGFRVYKGLGFRFLGFRVEGLGLRVLHELNLT